MIVIYYYIYDAKFKIYFFIHTCLIYLLYKIISCFCEILDNSSKGNIFLSISGNS